MKWVIRLEIWQVEEGRTSKEERQKFRKQGIIIDVIKKGAKIE